MKSISEAMTTNPMEKFKQTWSDARNKDWYFTGFIQKTVITFCFLYTVFSALYNIWRLIT